MYQSAIIVRSIARPYAIAAFNFAQEHYCIEKWQKMLSYIVKIINNKYMIEFTSNVNDKKCISNFLIDICQKQIDKYMINFIKIISYNNRLKFFPLILKEYINIRNIFEKKTKVEMITTQELNNEELNHIKFFIKKYLSCKINLTYKIDKNLIAGIILRIGNLVIDGSVRGRITRLTEFLQV